MFVPVTSIVPPLLPSVIGWTPVMLLPVICKVPPLRVKTLVFAPSGE